MAQSNQRCAGSVLATTTAGTVDVHDMVQKLSALLCALQCCRRVIGCSSKTRAEQAVMLRPPKLRLLRQFHLSATLLKLPSYTDSITPRRLPCGGEGLRFDAVPQVSCGRNRMRLVLSSRYLSFAPAIRPRSRVGIDVLASDTSSARADNNAKTVIWENCGQASIRWQEHAA